MTNTSTSVSLANRALLQIGSRVQISSLNEHSTQSDAVDTLFLPTYQSLGRAARWNWCRKQGTLSLLAAATGTPENPNGTTLPLPPVPWLYSYQLPVDSLAMRNLVPSLPAASGGVPPTSATVASPIWLPNSGQIPFAVAYDIDAQNNPITIILTNQSQAIANYTVNQPNPVVWDSQFEQAFVSSLAAFLVPALSLNLPLMNGAIAAAEKMIQTARVNDGNEGVTSVNREADWIVARAAGGGWPYWLYGGMLNYPCSDICWPGAW